MGRTLYDKIWDEHVVHTEEDGTSILYIDRHLVHEVTSPQAFEGLEMAGRKVWRLSANLAVSDHNVPTTDRSHGIQDPVTRLQGDTVRYFTLKSPNKLLVDAPPLNLTTYDGAC